MVVLLTTTKLGGSVRVEVVSGVVGGGGHHLAGEAVGGEEGVVLFSVEGAQRLLIFVL